MKRLLAAAVAVLGMAACTAPFYDPAIGEKLETLGQTTVRAATGSLQAPDMNNDGQPDFDLLRDQFVLMPERASAGGLDIPANGILTRGFVLRRDPWGNVDVWYQSATAEGAAWMRAPESFYDEPGVPNRWPVSLEYGAYLGGVVLDPGSSTYAIERLVPDLGARQLSFDPPPHWIDLVGLLTSTPLGFTASPAVSGLSVSPTSTAGQDRVNILAMDSTGYLEAGGDLSFSGLSTLSPINGATPYWLPLPSKGVVIYHHDDNPSAARSFAQTRAWDGWHTWAWASGAPPSPPVELPGVTHRIDAVLAFAVSPGATSYLFSAEEQVGRVYSYDGTTDALVAEFPLGTLRFIGEVYHQGVWVLVFSRFIPDGGNLRFEIRSIEAVKVLTAFGPP